MITFLISVVLSTIISWCVYGKNFNQNLIKVGTMIFSFVLISTIVSTIISCNSLPTKKVYSEQSKLIPLMYDKYIKDTSILMKDGIVIDTVVNYDSISKYFTIVDSCFIKFNTNYAPSRGYIEYHNINNIKVIKIDTLSWYGIIADEYITDNMWVTSLSLPNINHVNCLYLNEEQYCEFEYICDEFKQL